MDLELILRDGRLKQCCYGILIRRKFIKDPDRFQVTRQGVKLVHSRVEHFEMKVADLLAAMQKMFDHRSGKLELRRKFEAREWRSGESFADYCHHKLILGNMVPISDDDIVDYVIVEYQLRHYKIKNALF